MPMRASFLRILLITLIAVTMMGASISAAAEEAPPMVSMSPQSMKYEPIPDMPACATGAILRGNPRNGPFWVMLKLASGCRVPLHWHSANEDIVVISGQGEIAMTDGPPLRFAPGAYASLPSKHTHQASCKRSCLLFTSSDGAYDIHYLDSKGEEISAEKALKLKPKRK